MEQERNKVQQLQDKKQIYEQQLDQMILQIQEAKEKQMTLKE